MYHGDDSVPYYFNFATSATVYAEPAQVREVRLRLGLSPGAPPPRAETEATRSVETRQRAASVPVSIAATAAAEQDAGHRLSVPAAHVEERWTSKGQLPRARLALHHTHLGVNCP